MKKAILFAAALFVAVASFAQNEYNYQKRSLFELLPIRGNDIVFLGNSITDGCEWAELFNNRHIKNRGISADRSGWLLDRLDPIVNGHPKKLFLMIGTNDLAAGVSPEEVAANIGKLLDRFAEESPWTKIYVQSILPVNGVDTKAKAKNHWKKGAEIIEANKLIEALCEGRKNVLYIDVYSALVDQKGMLDQRYTNDGLHLMGEGYLAYFRRRRLERAAELLRTTPQRVQDIAARVGYESQGRFAQAFYDQFRLTPLEYRRLSK